MRLRPSPGRRQPNRLVLLLRGWRLDRNPLRRGSDRLQTVVLGALLALFLAGAPFAAMTAGGAAGAQAAREARVQLTEVHQVLATAVRATLPADMLYSPATVIRWRAPDGKLRTGAVYLAGGSAAHAAVPVWINQAGQLADSPLQPSQIAGRVQLAEGLAVTGLAVMLLIPGLLARRALNRRRMAAWDADWLAYGPRWSPRRRGSAGNDGGPGSW